MSNPQAYVTVRKSRLRTESNNTVYLEKNVEFEIELYNPTTDRIGALITINGKAFPQKFILRPGERAFIERYLDEAKKFLFDTYFVDGSSETKQAIKDNGGIQVQFYRERQPVFTPSYNGPVVINNHWPSYQPLYRSVPNYDNTFYSTCAGSTQDFNISSSNLNLSNSSNANASNTMSFADTDSVLRSYKSEKPRSKNVLHSRSMMEFADKSPDPVETGRVEKGGFSSQSFGTTTIDLEYWPFYTITLKLLPVSQRPQEATAYCSNCGRRARTKEKFCPQCGTKH